MIKIFHIFLLLFVLPLYLNAQDFKLGANSDTLTIHTKRLLDVDYRFKMILDDFIHHKQFKFHSFKKENIIFVMIDSYITFRASSSLIDSIYKDNDFSRSIYSFPYSVYIESIKKSSRRMISISQFQQYNYYNYNGFDVFFISEIPLEFPWLGSSVNKEYLISKKEVYSKTHFSTYTIGDFEVIKRKYIQIYSKPSGVSLKRKYLFDKNKSDLLKTE